MAGTQERDHYRVLGVPRSARADEIRRAHRRLATLLHPDRQGDASPAERRLAERRMREVNAAWTVLSNPQRRADYDRTLRVTSTSSPGTSPGGSTATATRPRPPGPVRPEDSDDPDEAFARARHAQVDPDEPELSAWQYHLLRRAPLVVVMVVGLVILVASAYATGGSGTAADDGPDWVPGDGADCVALVEGRNAIGADCRGENDGSIVERDVGQPLDCPLGSTWALLNNDYVCIQEPTTTTEPPTATGADETGAAEGRPDERG